MLCDPVLKVAYYSFVFLFFFFLLNARLCSACMRLKSRKQQKVS